MPILIPRSASTTLDANGNGTVSFAIDNTNQRWVIGTVLVRTEAPAASIPVPRADTYSNAITPQDWLGGTYSGNLDAAPGQAVLYTGDVLYVVWTGGVPGVLATATIGGTFDPAGRPIED